MTAAAVAALALLAGCSSDKQTDWTALFGMISQSFGRGEDVTREQAAAVPFASIGVRVGDDPEGMLVLGSSNGEERLWTAATHVVLLIRSGRVVRTAGLEFNLGDLRNLRGINGAPSAQGSSDTAWEADLPDQHIFSVPIACHSNVRGPEAIKVLGSTVATVRVDEDCRSDKLDWTFTNSYWIAPQSGLVWRSIQHISPKLDPLEVRILRPPAS
ncbi:MAG TPA: YjbF family lipoprotein [Rhizomicrobium sp.]